MAALMLLALAATGSPLRGQVPQPRYCRRRRFVRPSAGGRVNRTDGHRGGRSRSGAGLASAANMSLEPTRSPTGARGAVRVRVGTHTFTAFLRCWSSQVAG